MRCRASHDGAVRGLNDREATDPAVRQPSRRAIEDAWIKRSESSAPSRHQHNVVTKMRPLCLRVEAAHRHGAGAWRRNQISRTKVETQARSGGGSCADPLTTSSEAEEQSAPSLGPASKTRSSRRRCTLVSVDGGGGTPSSPQSQRLRPRFGAVGDLSDRSRQPQWHGAFVPQQQQVDVLDPPAADVANGRPDTSQDAIVNTVMQARNMMT